MGDRSGVVKGLIARRVGGFCPDVIFSGTYRRRPWWGGACISPAGSCAGGGLGRGGLPSQEFAKIISGFSVGSAAA